MKLKYVFSIICLSICRFVDGLNIHNLCESSIHFWDLISQIHISFTIHIFNSFSFRFLLSFDIDELIDLIW